MIGSLLLLSLAAQGAQTPAAAPPPKAVALQNVSQATLTMFRTRMAFINWGGDPNGWTSMAPNTVDSENIGMIVWNLQDSNYKGKGCKLYQAESTWRFYLKARDGSKQWYSPKVYVMAHIDPQGKLLRTQTSYAGYGQPIQVTATYGDETITSTVTKGRDVQTQEIFPNETVNPFNDIFTPMIEDGLVTHQDHRFLMLNPYTGTPFEVKTQIAGRFQGKMFDAPFEGYRVRSMTKDGEVVAFISRAGQMLRVETLKEYEGMANEAPIYSQWKNWKRFVPADWNSPISVSQPDRPRFVTYMVPVMLDNPKLLVPWPCVVAV